MRSGAALCLGLLGVVCGGCRRPAPQAAILLPMESDAGLAVPSDIDAATPPGVLGPMSAGGFPPRACTGPRASGMAVLCVRAGDRTRIATLREALKSAKGGDVIQVAGGTYSEDIVVASKELTLAGGFDSTFSARNLVANESRIEGSGKSSVVRLLVPDGKKIVIDGFTITGGSGDSETARSGAGISSSGGDATFSNNRIVKNQPAAAEIHMTDTRGGGILANGSRLSKVWIAHNVIEGNVSGRGAGIASSNVGRVVIEGNIVRNNRGYSDHGGGLFVDSPKVEIRGNLIDGNEIGPTTNPYGYGGGVYLHGVGTVATMSFDVIVANAAVTVGSGIFVDNGAHATLSHELVYRNRCTEAGGAAITVDSTDDAHPIGSIVVVAHSTVTGHRCSSREHGDGILIGGSRSTATVTDSIFWDNGEQPFNFARAAEGPPVVSHSWIDTDPGFVDATKDDFHLRSGSPAIGYGAFPGL